MFPTEAEFQILAIGDFLGKRDFIQCHYLLVAISYSICAIVPINNIACISKRLQRYYMILTNCFR